MSGKPNPKRLVAKALWELTRGVRQLSRHLWVFLLRFGKKRYRGLLGLVLLGLVLCIQISPALPQQFFEGGSVVLLEQGLSLYGERQFEAAIEVWQRAAQQSQRQGDIRHQAIASTYLALAYQELGNWSQAEAAIATSLALLQSNPTPDVTLAQALNARGRLEFLVGRSEAAIATWQQATEIYRQLGDEWGVRGGLINQAQAMEASGFYRRACATLLMAMGAEQSCEIAVSQDIEPLLQAFTADSSDQTISALGLRSLGNILRLMGYLPQSRQVLERSLSLGSSAENAALLSLGNTERAFYQQAKELYERTELEGDGDRIRIAAHQALQRYEAAIANSAEVPSARLMNLQAKLQRLSLLIDFQHWLQTQTWRDEAAELQPQIQVQIQALLSENIASLPLSQTAIYTQLHLAQTLVQADRVWMDTAVQMAQTANQQAAELQDPRTQSYALGVLGGFYEQMEPPQLSQARQLTESALELVQPTQIWEIAYRWQWHLGRLYRTQGEMEKAIAYYRAAVESLQWVRKDLVAINADLQFSFRDTVEPVYREWVTLLLQAETDAGQSQENLQQVVQAIDTLQLTELENFLRCNLTPSVAIDQTSVDPTAAVIHTIILENQLAVIVRLPGSEPLRLHTVPVAKTAIDQTLNELRGQLTRPFLAAGGMELAQQVYDWLIRPVASVLSERQIKTLVFMLDGTLRNVPMGVLHDGQRYLIEQYAIALTPGLQLLQPRPLTRIPLNVLTFGLSEMRQGFPPHAGFAPLKNVEQELQEIQSQVPSQTLLNESFTSRALQNWLRSSSSPIVHLATHGQFSSNPEDTFILAWDERIDVNTLSNLLQSRDTNNPHPIELLVLSACKTADGDRRATLGLAGMAVQSGARSTIASIWSVDDAATAELMGLFYRELANADPPISRSEALRRAQVTLLNTSGYQAPRFWAPYILVGNWL